MKSILDPSFRYTPSAGTDLRKTFARIRRKQKTAAQVPAQPQSGAPSPAQHPEPAPAAPSVSNIRQIDTTRRKS